MPPLAGEVGLLGAVSSQRGHGKSVSRLGAQRSESAAKIVAVHCDQGIVIVVGFDLLEELRQSGQGAGGRIKVRMLQGAQLSIGIGESIIVKEGQQALSAEHATGGVLIGDMLEEKGLGLDGWLPGAESHEIGAKEHEALSEYFGELAQVWQEMPCNGDGVVGPAKGGEFLNLSQASLGQENRAAVLGDPQEQAGDHEPWQSHSQGRLRSEHEEHEAAKDQARRDESLIPSLGSRGVAQDMFAQHQCVGQGVGGLNHDDIALLIEHGGKVCGVVAEPLDLALDHFKEGQAVHSREFSGLPDGHRSLGD